MLWIRRRLLIRAIITFLKIRRNARPHTSSPLDVILNRLRLGDDSDSPAEELALGVVVGTGTSVAIDDDLGRGGPDAEESSDESMGKPFRRRRFTPSRSWAPSLRLDHHMVSRFSSRGVIVTPVGFQL